MDNDNNIREIFDRMVRLTEELNACKKALIESPVIEQYISEYGELFMERDDMNSSVSQVTRMIHHLLKFRFTTSNRALKNWYRTIKNSRDELVDITAWNIKKDSYNKNIVRYISDMYDDIYEDAVARYETDANKYSDLAQGLNHIPKECPWSIRDLIRTDYSDLLSMIPPYDEDDRKFLESHIESIEDFASED